MVVVQPRAGPGGRQDAPEGKQSTGQGRCRGKMRQRQGDPEPGILHPDLDRQCQAVAPVKPVQPRKPPARQV